MKNNKLSYITARLISTLFVPPTFTVLTFVYLAFLFEKDAFSILFVGVNSLVFGLFLPLFIFVKFRKTDKISDIDASVKNERNAPYLLNMVFCTAAIPPLLVLRIDPLYSVLWTVYLTNTVLLYLINRKWKISAHLIAASISAAVLLFIEGNIPIVLIILILLLGWARIELKVHSLAQVAVGGITGFTISYLTLKIIYLFILG